MQTKLRASSTAASDDAVAALGEALQVVRGRPFTSAHGYAWANAYGFVAHAEAIVVDAAHLLAAILLDSGDAGAALDATAVGLRAAPANEILYRDRMLAHHQLGNISGVEGDLRDLCAALEVEDPCDELHPDTVSLHERLTRRDLNQGARGTRRGRALISGENNIKPRCHVPKLAAAQSVEDCVMSPNGTWGTGDTSAERRFSDAVSKPRPALDGGPKCSLDSAWSSARSEKEWPAKPVGRSSDQPSGQAAGN